MKTKKFAFVLLAIVFSISVFATQTPKMNIVALNDSKAIVTAVTDPLESSEISIVSHNGEIVYYKRAKAAAGFRSVFDLSELKNGMYTVKLKTGAASVKSEIEVSNGTVQVKPTKTEIEPYFSYDKKLLKVSYLNFDQKDISMLVYNGGELVFQADLGNDFTIQRAFDVSKMVDGKFQFILAGTGENYSYKVNR
ncbi:MAG TPA: T9SS type A sorting domain-containing protein [Draconibacterium sp.]|nr:T9SS type A sorting domain-containing protein [Draconibacterium sp.]